MTRFALLLAALAWSLTAVAAGTEHSTLATGSPAPDFKLPGVDGKTYSLKDFAAAKVLVIVFTCNHCPTAQAYEQRIMQLNAGYKDKGVALVAIQPNDPLAVRLDELGYTDLSDSFDEMKIRAKQRGFAFPYLYDGATQATAAAYGVVATPHVFIFDADRKLRYQGRIDDSEVHEVHSHDAANALDAMLAGKPAPTPTTHVFGCSTKWASKRDDAKAALAKWDAETADLNPVDAAGIAALAKNDSGKLRLVNVWATWCGPCVNEMPQLVTMHRMYRKRAFEFVTISMDDLDRKDKALKALNDMHVSATNYIFAGDDKDKLVDALDKEGWQGPVPYTMLIAPGGKVLYRHQGEIDPLEVRAAIVDYIGRTYKNEK